MADQASRSPAPCQKSDRCQVCKWVNDKENQVVRRLEPNETEAILAGNSPLPFRSRTYWRDRQMEDHDLRKVQYYLKFGATPPKFKQLYRVKRYLQPQHGVYLSADNVLLAPSSKEFSTMAAGFY